MFDDIFRIGKDYFAETFIGLKLYEIISTKIPLYYAIIIAYIMFVAVRWIKSRRHDVHCSACGAKYRLSQQDTSGLKAKKGVRKNA